VTKTTSRIVTIVIIVLIVLLAGLIGNTILDRVMPLPAQGSAPAGQQGVGAQAFAQGAPQAGGAQGGTPAARPQAASGGAAQGARSAATVRVAEVVAGTIENGVVINGDVLAASQVSIYPSVGGKLTQVRFRVGDWVNQGQVVAMVDPSRPGDEYSESQVLSTVSGTVLSSPLNPGDTVNTSTTVLIVGDLSNLVVETFVPERFSNAAQRGLGALVSLEALPGETFPATVSEVSPVLDPASRTLRIRLRFNSRDSRIRAGMFATVSLVTNTHRDVPVIPRVSVINTYGSWIVFVADDRNIARRRVVDLGLENELLVEVLEGLELGDRVVSAGQNFLSDGDLVRIVE
jgi:multidrug efflux pump subunit AcrA (membrane-fusion protein)